MIKRTIYALADSRRFTRWVGARGMNWGFAQRFIAGEALDESLPAVAQLRSRHMRVTLDYLGEAVHDEAATQTATMAYCEVLDRIAAEAIGASISLKPTQLGLAISTELARANIARVVERARALDNFVRLDMEDSSTTAGTLTAFKSLREDYDNVGVVVQAYLRRTEEDVRALNAIGAPLRLCKGAYKEPASVAFQEKSEVDANYVRLAELLLQEGSNPAFATHDHRMIEHIIDYVKRHDIPPERFEFQMLYGVRRDYQQKIVDAGYGIRIYVPFGSEWVPYFMRRIAERPANAVFVLRAMLGR